MNFKRLARRVTATLIGAATVTSPSVSAENATLRVSIEGGAFNSKFKFFDASDGCPSYNDIPGAKHFLGGVRASSKGLSKALNVDQPVHVFLFRPRDTAGIFAAGGGSEIRRRALQVVLSGDATLRYTGFDDKVPTWEATGEIDVQPATVCDADDIDEGDVSDEPADGES